MVTVSKGKAPAMGSPALKQTPRNHPQKLGGPRQGKTITSKFSTVKIG